MAITDRATAIGDADAAPLTPSPLSCRRVLTKSTGCCEWRDGGRQCGERGRAVVAAVSQGGRGRSVRLIEVIGARGCVAGRRAHAGSVAARHRLTCTTALVPPQGRAAGGARRRTASQPAARPRPASHPAGRIMRQLPPHDKPAQRTMMVVAVEPAMAPAKNGCMAASTSAMALVSTDGQKLHVRISARQRSSGVAEQAIEWRLSNRTCTGRSIWL